MEEHQGRGNDAAGRGLFDYRELSSFLKMSEGTIRHWVMSGEIPFFKIGFHVRFSPGHIERWLDDRFYRGPAGYRRRRKKRTVQKALPFEGDAGDGAGGAGR